MSKLYSGAEIVFKCMEDQNVDHIFGYPGGAVLPIYDELQNFKSIKHVLVRHEQGAGHAAEGYARSSGKPTANLDEVQISVKGDYGLLRSVTVKFTCFDRGTFLASVEAVVVFVMTNRPAVRITDIV